MAHSVLVGLDGDLEQAVVGAIEGTSDLVVVRRCADMAELLAAALAGVGSIAVLDGERQPDRSLVSRLAQAGTATVVVCAPSERDRYLAMGATAVDYASGVEGVLDALRTRLQAGPVAAPDPVEQPQAPASRGRMVVVWGAHGAPGRTTTAINLAAELAATGQRTVLIDADLWGAAVAPALGLLEESAGLAAAVRAADQGTLDSPALLRLCSRISDRLLVLPGLPRSARWREVSGSGIDAVWEAAKGLAEWVVVEAPTWVPDDDAAGFDAVLGPRRNGVGFSALANADDLVVVGAAEPIGIQRLVQSLLDLDAAASVPSRRHVVVTRVRTDAAGPRPADSVREALHRFAGVDDVVLVPDDRPACDRAALAGAALTETAPRSPARAAYTELARQISGAGPVRGRRRRA